ncbi:MAG: (2Fe-2S)-binding protein [Bdellovibrionales bacterium]
MDQKPNKQRLICLCNEVSQETVEAAITRGCDTLGKIFDATIAGCGACGGSCQPTLRKMLESFQATGTFPDNPRHPSPAERDRKLKKG